MWLFPSTLSLSGAHVLTFSKSAPELALVGKESRGRAFCRGAFVQRRSFRAWYICTVQWPRLDLEPAAASCGESPRSPCLLPTYARPGVLQCRRLSFVSGGEGCGGLIGHQWGVLVGAVARGLSLRLQVERCPRLAQLFSNDPPHQPPGSTVCVDYGSGSGLSPSQ